MSIPAIRKRLQELAEEHDMPELAELAGQMYRQSSGRKASVRSPKLTPELAAEIRDYAAASPYAHQQDIAEHFGVNHGRVSEAINGLV